MNNEVKEIDMNYTPCTNPEAMFYKADLALLKLLEHYNIDLPCQVIVQLMTLATGLALATGFLTVALISWAVNR